MRINQQTVLIGKNAVLVPYRKQHVPQYHEWMKNPLIQQQTASEPLSVEEEYDMQRSWAIDQDKLTFIILSKPDNLPASISVDQLIQQSKMVGDVNIFLNPYFGDEEEEGENVEVDRQPSTKNDRYDAECEIMIAEHEYRRKGIAREALHLLFHYVTSDPTSSPSPSPPLPADHGSTHLPLPLRWLTCKISLTNEASIRLFESLGFEKVKVSQVWQEVEMRFKGMSDEQEATQRTLFASSLLDVVDWPPEADS